MPTILIRVPTIIDFHLTPEASLIFCPDLFSLLSPARSSGCETSRTQVTGVTDTKLSWATQRFYYTTYYDF